MTGFKHIATVTKLAEVTEKAQQHGSMMSDGKTIIALSPLPVTHPSPAQLQSILPPFIERELETANASQYNRAQLVETYWKDRSSQGALEAERQRLSSLLHGATDAQIKEELSRLISHFPQKNVEEQLEIQMYKDYIFDLKDYPAWMLAEACLKYRRDPNSQFFPRVAVLIALIKPRWHEITHKLKTIEKLLLEVGDYKQREERRLEQADWDKLKQACVSPEPKPETMQEKAQRTLDAMRKEGALAEDMKAFAEQMGVSA